MNSSSIERSVQVPEQTMLVLALYAGCRVTGQIFTDGTIASAEKANYQASQAMPEQVEPDTLALASLHVAATHSASFRDDVDSLSLEELDLALAPQDVDEDDLDSYVRSQGGTKWRYRAYGDLSDAEKAELEEEYLTRIGDRPWYGVGSKVGDQGMRGGGYSGSRDVAGSPGQGGDGSYYDEAKNTVKGDTQHITLVKKNSRGKLIGEVKLEIDIHTGEATIANIHVEDKYKGKGHGTEIYKQAIRKAAENGATSFYSGGQLTEDVVNFHERLFKGNKYYTQDAREISPREAKKRIRRGEDIHWVGKPPSARSLGKDLTTQSSPGERTGGKTNKRNIEKYRNMGYNVDDEGYFLE